ncbi:MAG TPA: Rieske 2Fe-2S domain-containing protein [Chloroflexota bacterium]|nr:Rieske 2Fe-2S domain-containing protein [Chloroflexota bacterium]
MLTPEENERLTRVGPGTPCGEFLRRYWHPVGFVAELTPERPKLRAKVLHEELVVFRDAQGNYGCLAEHCPHRGVSLYYGFVEDCAIRCPYHGWKFDTAGNCLEQPFEPAGSTFKDRIQQRAYPVQALGGVLFVYLGPPPAPLLPRWDVLAWPGHRKLYRWEPLACNWLQVVENSVDITHTYYLHGHALSQQGQRGPSVDYFYRPIVQHGVQPFEWGIVKSWVYVGNGTALGDEIAGGTPMVFPGMVRVLEYPWQTMHFRVPVDDTTTQVFWVGYLVDGEPTAPWARAQCAADCRACARLAAGEAQDPAAPFVHTLMPERLPGGDYAMNGFFGQDRMAWETAGPVFDRSAEHLATSDRGILLFRQMLREQIDAVAAGRDPLGTIRDPARDQVIELPAWVTDVGSARSVVRGAARASVASLAAVFDERHEVITVDPTAPVLRQPSR